MKRFFDIVIATIALVILIIPIIGIAIAVRFTSSGPILYWSKRVGKDNRIFLMPKFRTMINNAPVVATHLLESPERWLTPIGSFLRKSSLDELPQVWSIIKGDMSLVGPRPALFNQYDLISLRSELGVHKLVPGLTGWAQINGRDDLSINQKIKFDADYLRNRSFLFDLKIIWVTIVKIITFNNVSH